MLDANGKKVAPELTDRCISISGEQLRAIDEVVAVAGGRHKTAAVRPVLISEHANSLVADTTLVRELLATR